MTPTMPFALGAAATAAAVPSTFTIWLDRITTKFRDAEPNDGKKNSHFLVRLSAQSELAEGTAKLLIDGLQEKSAVRFSIVTEELVVCAARGREMDEEMARLLTHAILVPFDSEDLKSISLWLTQLVESMRDVAIEVERSGELHPSYIRIQEQVLACQRAASSLIAGLCNWEYEHALWVARREAKRALRVERMATLDSGDVRRVVCSDGVFRRFGHTLELMKRLNMTASWMRFKNG